MFLWVQLYLKLTLVEDSGLYNEGLCGKQVEIVNLANGNSVTVIIADECPSCRNDESIDMSLGTFKTLDQYLGDGVLNIKWKYL